MMSEWSISQRRVCRVLQLDPKSYRDKSQRPAQAVRESKIRDLSDAYSLWLSSRACSAAVGGVDDQLKKRDVSIAN
jgi:hypothetical protein